APLSNLVIADVTPPYTAFVSASAGVLPAGLTGCTMNTPANPAPAAAVNCALAQSVGGTGVLQWILTGSLHAGGSGTVSYKVTID
ncbi:hypothetical protein, partial [Piscinibacter sp.]|uniref:hypothetical protein n=1 Tax=Piscinibacter sp. TaxID=1903157 RepID=UPI002CA2A54C